MKQKTRIFMLALCMTVCVTVTPAQATAPCVTLKIKELQTVVNKSDYIVHGEILKNGMFKRGTHIRIIKSYKGNIEKKRLFVTGWFYNSPPLTTYEKGNQIVFILSNSSYNEEIILTDDRWENCVPSIFAISSDGMVYNPYTKERMLAEDYIQALINYKEQDSEN